MATTVNVLCPNGRRVNIKVTPATTLLQVLEQTCDKQKFDPACHTLKHHNKCLDLNNLFRYTNLPQNAKLEMVPTKKPRTESSEVTLAVQCEDGRRVQGKFDPSTTSLWGVLTKLGVCEFEGGRLEPVVAYTNNQICGEAALQKKTLRDLGLTSGRAVIRLLFRERQTSQPLAQEKVDQSSQKEEEPAAQDKMESGDETGAQTKQEGSSEEVKLKTDPSESTPMETEEAVDDEQPKSKPKTAAQTGTASQPDSSISSQTGLAAVTGTDADMPYFPAHPISYFPDEVESSATAASKPPPSRQTGPVSMFDQQFSLFAIDENGPPLQVPTLEPFKFPAVTSMPQAKSVTRAPPPKVYDEACDRERVVFHLDTSLPSPLAEVPDEFFDVTVEDVQRIHDDHKKQLESFSDTPLMTQTMRIAQMEKKYESYGKAVVRVHFPDRWVLQGCFRPRESLKALVQFIRDSLADPQVKFHLYTTPPKQVLKNGKMTFIEAGFVPAAIVHVGVESSHAPQTLLSEDILKEAQSGVEAEIVVAKKRELKQDPPSSSLPSQRPRPAKSQARGSSASGGGGGGGGGGTSAAGEARKVPKWFKMGK